MLVCELLHLLGLLKVVLVKITKSLLLVSLRLSLIRVRHLMGHSLILTQIILL